MCAFDANCKMIFYLTIFKYILFWFYVLVKASVMIAKEHTFL